MVLKNYFYLGLLLSIFVSCNSRQTAELQELDPVKVAFSPDESRVLASFSAPKTISKDQAIAFATFAATSFGVDAASSKSSQRTVGDVSVLTKSATDVSF